MKDALGTALIGLLFGVVLSRLGFTSWDEVHRMFVFTDLRLVLAFGTAVVALALAWRTIHRVTGATWAPRSFHRGTIPGAVLFGAGWAISGACPSIAFVQLGEGELGALATIAGIFVGNAAYGFLNRRLLHLDSASCADQ